ncbi:glutaredoxin-1 [Rhizoclosmatium globosum]|uniref:Glutaredoxin-1 n=1 Tax=Rhizoclosmatium globosum TaxID=329046 RepID=A0A1Y2CHS3_9FUNG|nr:glutaredoxin-1 [Rhizoclosmatium globosum]|eukprot:ORY45865.1 glutaredoxin-1 [Rhizoclosmatium globosum]
MADAKKFVDAHIAENKVIVFSKSWCPYCSKAKSLLKNENISYTAVELDSLDNGDEIQAYLAQLTGQRTVPNIFINQKHIGGCDAIHAIFHKGNCMCW